MKTRNRKNELAKCVWMTQRGISRAKDANGAKKIIDFRNLASLARLARSISEAGKAFSVGEFTAEARRTQSKDFLG
jgi:hypothetical protein